MSRFPTGSRLSALTVPLTRGRLFVNPSVVVAAPVGTTAERWRRLADDVARRVDAVPADRWDDPAPGEGGVARDVVAHLVEWMTGLYLGAVGRPPPAGPSVDDDPAGAWRAADRAIHALPADPRTAHLPTSTRAGDMTLEDLTRSRSPDGWPALGVPGR